MSQPSASALAELLELTARVLHSRGYAAEMFPAQWAALRYFSRAVPERRTASDLARFQGLANGPVSRTVRTLLQKGLLAKSEAQPRGRAERLELTESARELLVSDPTHAVEAALSEISEADRASLGRTLQHVLKRLSPGS